MATRFGRHLILLTSLQVVVTASPLRNLRLSSHPRVKAAASAGHITLRNASSGQTSPAAAGPTPVGSLDLSGASSHAGPPNVTAGTFNARANSSGHHADGKQDYGYGVVHFLFLINDQLPHSDIWRSFFASAPEGSWKALVHCKDPYGCSRSGVLVNNPGFQMVPTTGTWYCHDLVTAMHVLLQAAVNLNAAWSGGREKFVFVSESTLPTKPFIQIYTTLLQDDDSDFCVFPSNQWASAHIDGHFTYMMKHHQWVVLSRSHAEAFIKKWVPVDWRGVWQVWLRGGSWEGRERFVSPQHFYHPPAANWCTDEYAFIATIFGSIEYLSPTRDIPGFGGGPLHLSGPQSLRLQGRCRTFTYWDNEEPAFANLAGQIYHDVHGSSISCYPKCYARPATLERLSDASLHALRASPFLFARKVSSTAWMPNYASIVLSA